MKYNSCYLSYSYALYIKVLKEHCNRTTFSNIALGAKNASNAESILDNKYSIIQNEVDVNIYRDTIFHEKLEKYKTIRF